MGTSKNCPIYVILLRQTPQLLKQTTDLTYSLALKNLIIREFPI